MKMVKKKTEKKMSTCGSLLLVITVLLFVWIVFVAYRISSSAPLKAISSGAENSEEKLDTGNLLHSVEMEIEKEILLLSDHSQFFIKSEDTHHKEKNIEIISSKPILMTPSPPIQIENQIEREKYDQSSIEKPIDLKAEQKKPKLTPSEPPIHIVFSTDCGGFQDWQTIVFFYSAKTIQQHGQITRIASGCDVAKQAILTELYQKLFPDDNFHVHFTPDYKKDERTGKSYHFYNKPYGVLHWIEHASPPIPEGTIVAICDPDFIFLRPLTTQLSNQQNTIVTLWKQSDLDAIQYISKGHPVAQQYGLGAPWVRDDHPKFNRTFVCGSNSPCTKIMDQRDGGKAYSVGPPYLVEVSDLHRLTTTWCQFVPRVYVKYPYLLAEMYGYSMAAAHENLPHLTLDHYMVSDIDSWGEGWEWIDNLGEGVCELPDPNGIYFRNKPLPTFIHYCQAYRIDGVGYGKRRIPHEIFDCPSPMLLEPDSKMVRSVSFMKDNQEIQSLKPHQVKRNAFVICVASRVINNAIIYYKQKMCANQENVNYEKTLNIFAPPTK